MPNIYLSPSTQERNEYITGGTEEQYMNLLADAVIPYLDASGISYTRNTPDMTAASSIAQANAGNYDLYVALHSNAASEMNAGMVRGSDVYYYPGSKNSARAADLFVKNMAAIYPLPDLVRKLPTTALGEVSRTRAPAVLLEVAFHDNVEDATWISENIPDIARAVALSIVQYFGLPLAEPQPPQQGRVSVVRGPLNIRSRPSLSAPAIAAAPKGAPVTVLGQVGDWSVVRYKDKTGYAFSKFITRF